MPLSPPAPREALHFRAIDCSGYRREDGLWDIEAHLVDTKSYVFSNAYRGNIALGEALHDMWLRLTIDDGLVVRAVEAVTDDAPFAVCPAITPRFERLVGLTIGPGWSRTLRQRLGGVNGCTHLVELLRPLATVALQTVWTARKPASGDAKPPPKRRLRPGYIDSCHALKADGEVVREHFPEWYNAPDA